MHRATIFLPQEIRLQQKEHGYVAAAVTEFQIFLAQAFPQDWDSGGIQYLGDLQEYFGLSPLFGSLYFGHH